MEVVIDILKEEYDRVCRGNKSPLTDLELMRAVANGIPLPKNHGDLIDRNELLDKSYETVSKYCSTHMYEEVVNVDDIKSAHAIIKADKEDDLHEDSD